MSDRHVVAFSHRATVVSSTVRCHAMHLHLSNIPLGVGVRHSLRMLLIILGSRLGVGTVARVRLALVEIYVCSRVSLRVVLIVGCEYVDNP